MLVGAFAITLAWSIYAQDRAASDARLLRTGYVPLLLSLGTALQTQDTVAAQLNHITDAKNPADARLWIETQRKLRPLSFAGVRSAVDRGLRRHRSPEARALGAEITQSMGEIEGFLATDRERLEGLFDALERGEQARAEELRSLLLEHEIEGARRLRELGRSVERAVDELLAEAAFREQRAISLLIVLSIATLLVGLLTTLYARRVLAPLALVTTRAQAVARGDLTARPAARSDDEIGELSETFEAMVAAIAKARGELVQAERLAAVGRMAAQVTHEIRNPISALGLNVEMLEEELVIEPSTGEAKQLLSAIKNEVDRLAALSEQYLRLARRPQPDRAPTDVVALCEELLRFVAPELGAAQIACETSFEPGLPDLSVDEAQLRQALLNLVRNAREAMPSGGTLSVAVRAQGDGVELCVEDTGEGIPEEVRAKLFDPFFTTKKQGTGLGLAVTREIVDAHAGRVSCEPREGKGTRFVIWLPA